MMPDTAQSRRALTCLYIHIYFIYCKPLERKEEEDHAAHEPAQPCLSLSRVSASNCSFPLSLFSSISKKLFSVGTTCDDYCDNGHTRRDDGLFASHFSQVEDSVYGMFWLIGWCRSWPGRWGVKRSFHSPWSGPWRNWEEK